MNLQKAKPWRRSCDADRSDRVAFKGIALYNWVQQGVWQFAICPGTNRNKTFAEISTTCQSIDSMESLKASLANLAMQENVLWSASLPELKFPPGLVVDDVVKFAKANQVTIFVANR